jgi:hypothetical protein
MTGHRTAMVRSTQLTHLGQHLRIAAFETMLTTLGSLDQIATMQ